MKLRLNFGSRTPEIVVSWWQPITAFPGLVTYKNVKYEFVIYDEDDTGMVDYDCVFSEVRTYDPNWHATTYESIEMLFSIGPGPLKKCECGSKTGERHMFFCPLWSKF